MLKETLFLCVISIMMEANPCLTLESLTWKPSKSSITDNILVFSYFDAASSTEWLGFGLFLSFFSWQSGLDFPYIKFTVVKLLFT